MWDNGCIRKQTYTQQWILWCYKAHPSTISCMLIYIYIHIYNTSTGSSVHSSKINQITHWHGIKLRAELRRPTPNNNNENKAHTVYAIDTSHYDDVIMTTLSSQITSLAIVYSIVYSDADQRKHQSSASLAFVWGIHRDRWIPRTKGQLRGKCFHLMTSSRIACVFVWQITQKTHSHFYMCNWHIKWTRSV